MMADMFIGVLFSKTAPRIFRHLFLDVFGIWKVGGAIAVTTGTRPVSTEDDQEFQSDKRNHDWMD